MAGGRAHGPNRQYQVRCRDVLIYRDPELTPWAGDGIDVPFDLPDTVWTLDIALRDGDGALLVAECRRTVDAVKQDDVASFAYKVELLRKSKPVPVAGVIFAKTEHQIGAVKVGAFNGIEIAILEERSTPPGFNITFLRYDAERERRCQELIMHLAPGALTLTGYPATLIHGRAPGDPGSA